MIEKDGFNEFDYLDANADVKEAIALGQFSSAYEHYKLYGYKEGRLLKRALSRKEKVFCLIDKSGLGLEMGPSHNPLAPKKEGFNVKIVDHASAADLRAKYINHPINLDNIEEVDFVSEGQPLSELVGSLNTYDWIIASHVVEHLPNLISFFQECEKILKPGGVLSLVVPDKRYCFDHLGTLTSTGQLLDAWHEKRKKPSHGQVFDYVANSCQRGEAITWDEKTTEKLSLMHTFANAEHSWHRSMNAMDYIDVHCWRFTPKSFELILLDLFLLKLSNLKTERQYPTAGCEFYVSLVKQKNDTSNGVNIDARMSILESIQNEIN